MKRIILLIATFLIILSGFAQDKLGSIDKNDSYVNLSFTAADTINESETYWIQITAPQNYSSMQDVYVDLDKVSGTPNVYISLYGKLTSSSSWTAVGDSVNYAGSADTTFTMSFTTPNRYRYYKVQFRSNATDQQSLISDVQFKQWYSGGSVSGSSITDGTATLSGGALSGVTTITLENGLTIDNAVNNKLEFNENSDELIWTFGSNTVTASSGDVTLFDYGTINLGTDALDLSDGNILNVGNISLDSIKGDGAAIALGSNAETVAINSSDWDIGTTGIVTGLGDITSDGKILTTDTIQGATLIATSTVVSGGYNFVTAAQLTIPATDSIVIVNTSIPALTAGLALTFVAEASNTGAVELTLNGVKKNVYEASDISALDANDIRNTQVVTLIYDGTQWQQVSQSGN